MSPQKRMIGTNPPSFLVGCVDMAPTDRSLAHCSSFVARDESLLGSDSSERCPRLIHSFIDSMDQSLRNYLVIPVPRYSRVCIPLPRLTALPQPSSPSLARSIAAPEPGLVRPYLRRPGSTDRPLPGALTAPRSPGPGAGREHLAS
jgi:hypothetical protein